jgi:hypothetical protein
MKLVKKNTELLLEFTSLEEALHHYLAGAIAGGAKVIGQDIKNLIDKSKELPKDEQDRVLNFLNKAYAAKRKGNKEEYLKYISMAVQATRQEMALGIQQRQPKKLIPPPPPPEAYADKLSELLNINEDINMKITQQQLKQIINEEIENMVEEKEIDEALLDKLKGLYGAATGGAGAVGKDVAAKAQAAKQAVSQKVTAVKTAAEDYKKKIVDAARTAGTKSEVASILSSVSSDIKNASDSLQTLNGNAVKLGLNLGLDNAIKALKITASQISKAQQSVAVAAEEE